MMSTGSPASVAAATRQYSTRNTRRMVMSTMAPTPPLCHPADADHPRGSGASAAWLMRQLMRQLVQQLPEKVALASRSQRLAADDEAMLYVQQLISSGASWAVSSRWQDTCKLQQTFGGLLPTDGAQAIKQALSCRTFCCCLC